MQIRSLKFFFFLIFFAAGATGQPVRFSLEDCLDYAMAEGLVRRQMILSEKAAELDLRQSRTERLPSLSGSVGENMSHSRGERRTVGGSASVNAGMTLFQGGALGRQIKQDELLVGQAETRTRQYDNTLAIDVVGSYFSILGYVELKKYQSSLVATAQEQVRDAGERFHEGAMLESDYMMLRAQLEQNKNSAAQTDLNLADEMRNLKRLMSMPLDTELELTEPDMTMDELPEEADFVARAQEVLPDRALLDYGVRTAQSGLKIARAGYFPTVSLSGGLSTGHSGRMDIGGQIEERFAQSAGVSMSVPIFNRNRTRTSVARSKIALQQAELERTQGELDVRRMLLGSYSDAVSALGDYNTSQVREEAYRSSLEAYRAQYAAGLIKPVDLLQQENNYINVLYEFIQSKYGFLLRRRVLDVYTGGLSR